MEEEQFEPDTELENQPRVHHVGLELNSILLRSSLALSRRVALEVDVPLRSVKTDAAFEDATGALRQDFGSIHHRAETVSGIGDISLSARLRLATSSDSNTKPWLLDLIGGISFPTGGTEEDPFDRGASGLEHQHVFFGSGTFDPQLRLQFYRTSPRFSTFAWLGGTAALEENDKGYQRGISGSAGFGVSSSFGLQRTSFQGQLEVQHTEPSQWRSQDARNSGRTDLVLALGASYQADDSWVFISQLRLPENLSARGGTLEANVVFSAGVSYSFHRD